MLKIYNKEIMVLGEFLLVIKMCFTHNFSRVKILFSISKFKCTITVIIFKRILNSIPQTLKFHMEDQEGKILGHCIHDITKLVPETENPFIETLLNENKKLTEIQLSFSV